MSSHLKDCQGVRWAANASWDIEWDTGEQEAISSNLLAVSSQSLEIPKFTDVQPKQRQEVLMEHCDWVLARRWVIDLDASVVNEYHIPSSPIPALVPSGLDGGVTSKAIASPATAAK